MFVKLCSDWKLWNLYGISWWIHQSTKNIMWPKYRCLRFKKCKWVQIKRYNNYKTKTTIPPFWNGNGLTADSDCCLSLTDCVGHPLTAFDTPHSADWQQDQHQQKFLCVTRAAADVSHVTTVCRRVTTVCRRVTTLPAFLLVLTTVLSTDYPADRGPAEQQLYKKSIKFTL